MKFCRIACKMPPLNQGTNYDDLSRKVCMFERQRRLLFRTFQRFSGQIDAATIDNDLCFFFNFLFTNLNVNDLLFDLFKKKVLNIIVYFMWLWSSMVERSVRSACDCGN
jgi:hypothetical protein